MALPVKYQKKDGYALINQRRLTTLLYCCNINPRTRILMSIGKHDDNRNCSWAIGMVMKKNLDSNKLTILHDDGAHEIGLIEGFNSKNTPRIMYMFQQVKREQLGIEQY